MRDKIKRIISLVLTLCIIIAFFNINEIRTRADSEDFNVYAYANRYVDLQKAFGGDLSGYEKHYKDYGIKEKRNGKPYDGNDPRNYKLMFIYVDRNYNGVDYSSVFDPIYYLDTYADLKAAFGDNQQLAFKHFINNGMREGRKGNDNFNVYAYANSYPDLQKAFGSNLSSYYKHYAQRGRLESRNCSPYAGSDIRNSKLNFTYISLVNNGVDYSAVFDPINYLDRYGDLKAAFGNDQNKAFNHFLNNGIKEGRKGNDTFNVYSYANRYQDLATAFGTDKSLYVKHYLTHGINENRNASGNDTAFNEAAKASEDKKPSVKKLLKAALEPVGSTLYVYGGGWNEEDTAAGVECMTYGVSPNWKVFFDNNNSSYNYKNTMYQIHNGLDCTGYVGYSVYQVFGNKYSNNGYVYESGKVGNAYTALFSSSYINRNNIERYYPGDIMCRNGHAFIVIGKCSDGSLLFLHASPPVVSLCGTATPGGNSNSEAVNLARTYMSKYYPESATRYNSFYRDTSYLKNYDQMHWNRAVLADPDGYDNMTPEQILKDLFNE